MEILLALLEVAFPEPEEELITAEVEEEEESSDVWRRKAFLELNSIEVENRTQL